MPGRRSLLQAQYYAHPHNAFWSIVLPTVNGAAHLPYVDKVRHLQQSRVALWDVLADCQRPGSLDSKIVVGSEVFNPLDAFRQQMPDLQAIFFNGQKAQSLFVRRFAAASAFEGLNLAVLPSTSPAHASLSKEQKARVWQQNLGQYLDSFAEHNQSA